jgi:hypothetical protein
VKTTPVVLKENINTTDPKKPATVNEITKYDGISPPLANPANIVLIRIPPIMPVTASPRPR